MTIEIIGRASVAPGAANVEELKQVLEDGRCTVTSIPSERWDLARFWHPVQGTLGKTYTYAAGVIDTIYHFDPAVFGLSQREAMHMDPQQRILLGLVWRALEDANLPPSSLSDERVGVYVGASSLDNGNLSVEDPSSGSPYFMTGNTLSIVSNRISHVFGLRGPSMTIDTACSSSLVALDQAARALERGDIDTAIVGGVNLLAHPLSFVGFAQARMLSPEGLCRAYDTNGHGYVRAEGGVAIVMRRTDRVLRERDRSYARLHATGVNSAGRTNGISLPSRESQAALLKSIYEGRDIDVNRIAFIEGHGTGTRVGDPAEVWAIGNVIGTARRAPVPIGSIKSNIGHTEPASGLFGLLKAMIALENNFLPATLHIEQTNEDIDFETLNVRVNTSAIELLPARAARFAGVNSFGFGGTNAHVVISDPDPIAPPEPQIKGDMPIFMVSAHSASALENLLQAYKDKLATASAKEARQMVSSAAANRDGMRYRFAVKARDADSVASAISAHLAGETSAGERGETTGHATRIAFVFSGNGSQWAGMGADAYRENTHFRQCFQSFSALFEYYLGEKLTDLIFAEDLAVRLADTKVAQPMLFAVQAALSDSLVAQGVRPEAVFGHSVGEIAAAYAAKALTAAEAVAIVAKRSQHQDMLAGTGKMAAVVLNEEAALAFARTNGFDNIVVAAINAPNSVTISGPADEVQAYRDAARKANIVAHVLDINYPFHHPIIDRAKDAFLGDLPDIDPESGNGTFISTVTGAALDGRRLDAGYWWQNVREPVLFRQAAEAAMDMGCNLFIEISPRPILSNYVSEIAKHTQHQASVIPTLLREPANGSDPVARSFARAVAHGVSPAKARGVAQRNAYLDLPQLPFEKVELRPQHTSDEIDIFGRDGRSLYTLLGWRTDPNGSNWKNHIDAHLFADLAEHVVDSKAIMPGAGFIEIAVTAAQQFYQTEHVEITNLEIVRPLELRKDRMFELSTVLSPETGDLEIRSRERLSHDDWTVHAFGRVRKFIGDTKPVYAEPVVGEVKSVLPAETTYNTAERFGLHYGPHFQLLSKAVSFAHGVVEVDLKSAQPPSHPYLAYNLNPMSVDSAFHGLVALFGEFSGDRAGAPYIPVRFGAIRVGSRAMPIAKARIEVERFSQNSLKARFRLFDAAGQEIAVLDDCRFRRTYLRRHHSLESVSFHYETIPSALTATKPVSVEAIAKTAPEALALSNASLLLDAAVYRACHEIALRLADRRGRVETQAIPGNAAFRAFLTSCLFSLEDAGIAVAQGDGWTVPSDYTLPPVAEILQELYHEDASRVAEAVLITNAYRSALERLSQDLQVGEVDDTQHARVTSEATMEHVLVHSPLSLRRLALAVEEAEAILNGTASEIRHVLEAGAISTAFSRRLAVLAAEKGAMLIIAEPRDNLRRSLEIAFEQEVHVTVLHPDKLMDHPVAGLIVAAGDESQSLLANNEAIRATAQRSAYAGGALILADRAPSAFNDFVFGLSDDWFAASQSSAFPVGKLATAGQIEELAADLGFTGSVHDMSTSSGTLLSLVASAKPAAQEMAKTERDIEPIVVLAEAGKPSLTSFKTISLAARSDRKAFISALEKMAGSRIKLLYLAERADKDPSQSLQARLQAFTDLAETLAGDSAAVASRPQLLIVAPGGSPVSALVDEANAGLWTFGRVLQNEYEFLDVHLIDASPADSALDGLIDRLLASQSANREWMVDSQTGELREVRAAGGPFPLGKRIGSHFAAATIRQLSSGRLDSIVWEASTPPVAAAGEVVVTVEATGLNFRDVMWAMGLLPEEALEDGFAGATIGMEFAGRISGLGDGVTDLQIGDKVMGIGPAAFSTHVRVRRDGVTKVPERIDTVAAATVPVVFLTAYYAMVELGRIRAGETILIHGAAGGVGLAALQIAKMKGAQVIATAGTIEKRNFLQLLGADHVFDSRTLDFVSDVRRVTGGEGVDLVLNSLFDEAMERSLELVKPFGRFLELGKRDYYADRKIGLRPFRRNISYFGIDADQLLVNVPDLTRRIFTEMSDLFAEGRLTPIPYRAFAHDEIATAFRLMQNAGHIGKIVVRPPVAGRDTVLLQQGKPLSFDDKGIYLIAGGIGGFGLEAAEWLVAKGARNIALCSRRGAADGETKKAMAAWQKTGVKAHVYACDITDETAAAAMLTDMRNKAPIKGIIHAAMVLDDALMSNLTSERNKPVVDVKVKGADVLHRLTISDSLDLFLMFSSATTMLGNPGQSNYVAANGYLEGLARKRRAAGLPGLAVGFGAIADKGYLARNAEVNELLSKRIGKTALRAQDALDQVERYMVADNGSIDAATVMIAEIDWNSVRMLPIATKALFETIMQQAGANQSTGDSDTIDLEEMIHGKSEEEAQALLHKLVAAEIASILRITEEGITPDKVLKDIGLDSLMAMELGMNFQQKTGFDIPLSGIGEGTTVGDVVSRLRERVANRSGSEQGEAEDVVRQLVQSHSGSEKVAAEQ
ncbi:SDR family NAD(P)-dependent oxidoreductase [Oryzifoliimicrobium ureilyticus]|uniref:SDR family NAD(P)-dependent oxidoreductase n=1 Tax=Oryzifoliimicrobium ureilyticus TaxID=3113724 RepID=UPI0030764A2F